MDQAYRPDTGGQTQRQSIERWTQAVAEDQAQNLLAVCTERHANADLASAIASMLELEDFERLVFVMSVLERYSDQDCSVLLGCSETGRP